MARRRHLIGPLIVALVLTGGVATALLLPEEPGAFPTDEEIARTGFAVWPVDTPEEAREECAQAQDWRKDAPEVALRFASDVLRYPNPTVDDDFVPEDEDTYRTLIYSPDMPGVFLGSVLVLERFGECWYVTEGMPREDDRAIDVVTFEAATKLLVPIGCCGSVVEVGWGDWTHTIRSRDRTDGSNEVLVDIPAEAKGGPGHYIVMDFDQGVSEVVGARTLPPLPTDEGAVPLAQIDIGRRPDDPRLCRMTWARREHPERIIRELRSGTFKSGLAFTKSGYLRYDRASQRGLGSNFEWRLRLDEAVMRISLSRAADRCWLLRSIEPRRAPLIENVSAAFNSFTYDLDPGRATKIVVYYGLGGEAQRASVATKELLGPPWSVSRGPDFVDGDEGLPAFALVMAYRYGNLHSVEYRLFEMPEGDF